jgi:hypothetical protein
MSQSSFCLSKCNAMIDEESTLFLLRKIFRIDNIKPLVLSFLYLAHLIPLSLPFVEMYFIFANKEQSSEILRVSAVSSLSFSYFGALIVSSSGFPHLICDP